MNLIKLDATTSTNSHIKQLYQSGAVQPPCCVTAQWQSAGRGQMGTQWQAEKGKNIIMSSLYHFGQLSPEGLFAWNAAVAVAVAHTLQALDIVDVSIKWPNDILSGSRKLAGILIENIFEASGQWVSIVGIGLNVNQMDFEGLPQAGSMYTVSQRLFDLDQVLHTLLEALELAHIQHTTLPPQQIWDRYHALMYRHLQPTHMATPDGLHFEATPLGVDAQGRLRLQMPNGDEARFALKEVQWMWGDV